MEEVARPARHAFRAAITCRGPGRSHGRPDVGSGVFRSAAPSSSEPGRFLCHAGSDGRVINDRRGISEFCAMAPED